MDRLGSYHFRTGGEKSPTTVAGFDHCLGETLKVDLSRWSRVFVLGTTIHVFGTQFPASDKGDGSGLYLSVFVPSCVDRPSCAPHTPPRPSLPSEPPYVRHRPPCGDGQWCPLFNLFTTPHTVSTLKEGKRVDIYTQKKIQKYYGYIIKTSMCIKV